MLCSPGRSRSPGFGHPHITRGVCPRRARSELEVARLYLLPDNRDGEGDDGGDDEGEGDGEADDDACAGLLVVVLAVGDEVPIASILDNAREPLLGVAGLRDARVALAGAGRLDVAVHVLGEEVLEELEPVGGERVARADRVRGDELDGLGRAAGLDERAGALVKAGRSAEAVELVTAYSVRTGDALAADWLEFFKHLFTKYMDGNVKTARPGQRDPSVSQPGYPKEWLARIVKDAGDRYLIPDGKHHDKKAGAGVIIGLAISFSLIVAAIIALAISIVREEIKSGYLKL